MDLVEKRNGDIVTYQPDKISAAVNKAIARVNGVPNGGAADQVEAAVTGALFLQTTASPSIITVNQIHTLVENTLMDFKWFEVAREYITYRSQHEPDLFRKRVAYKPFEYPQMQQYVDAIRHSYWVVDEFNFTADIQDFKTKATGQEQGVLQRAMLGISQVEAYSVKSFWSKIYDWMPKPEISDVGATFAESECRHSDAYSRLLETLGMNVAFAGVLDVPAIQQRISYLQKFVSPAGATDQEYMESVLLFSLFIENVSLFSQFLVVMAFDKERNMFSGISNAIQATSKEEDIHALFGAELINILRKEQPQWFTSQLEARVHQACLTAFEAECSVLDWIFEDGDLSFIKKADVVEFIKDRFNRSMDMINFPPAFTDVDTRALEQFSWFNLQMQSTTHVDFFARRSTSYSKSVNSFTEDDLF